MTNADYIDILYVVTGWESRLGTFAMVHHEGPGTPVVITLRDCRGNEAVLTCETTDLRAVRRGLYFWENRLARAARGVPGTIPIWGVVKV